MEQKLAEFRARRKAEMAVKKNECAERQPNVAPQSDDTAQATTRCDSTVKKDEVNEYPPPPAYNGTQHVGDTHAVDDWLLDSSLGRWLGNRHLAFKNLTLLKVLLWLVLLGLFSELEFGLPFFVISLFYWMYEGLRSPTARQPGEMSAYSVFNPDCQPLLGAITAEQLEAEMGLRHLATH